MYRIVSKLLVYSGIGRDIVIEELSRACEAWEKKTAEPDAIVARLYRQVKHILDVSTACGFDTNLWHNYLTWLLICDENSFSLTAEGVGPGDGSINELVLKDLRVFRQLFDFDFGPLERDLGIDCFTTITHYRAIPKREQLYDRVVSEKVRALSLAIEEAKTEWELFDLLTVHYRDCGVGMFGLDRAFRVSEAGEGLRFLPIRNADAVRLDDLVGYEEQKRELIANTRAFVEGKSANNVLLYGDSGTGKSTSVKAVLNEYWSQGLRMIEIYKHQFRALSSVIGQIKNRNYKFIVFIDDLSFEEDEVEYKFLKAVIEGGVETRPDNVLIYATSNRRHLIRETWTDRNDMEHQNDIHRSDTVEEKLSLSERFGVQINYMSPNRQLFLSIVETLAGKAGIQLSQEELFAEANRWELRHGGLSGRTARQFIDYLAGRQ